VKRRVALTFTASAALLAACGAPRWDTATYDQFPLNWRRAERGAEVIRVIALVPGGSALSDAIGVELARRGFVIIEPASTVGMVTGVDFKAVLEHHIPARRNPVEMWKLRNQLHARGVNAFLIVRTHDSGGSSGSRPNSRSTTRQKKTPRPTAPSPERAGPTFATTAPRARPKRRPRWSRTWRVGPGVFRC
jgi:hypothetical protein